MNLMSTLRGLLVGPDNRPDEEQRAIASLPFGYGGSRYDRVDQDRALSLGPVYASIRHITDLVSTLPLKAYRDTGDSKMPLTLPKLFADLNNDGMLVSWLCQGIGSLLVRGSAVGLVISRDGFQFPTAIQWLPMNKVTVKEGARPTWYYDGREVPTKDIVHVPWITMPGKTLGLSPIEHYALTIGTGLDTWKYGADWFKAGGVPPGTFKNTQKTITPDAARTIRQRLVESMRGHEPLVYGSDWDYNPIAIPPNEAQFIDTMKFTTAQIGALYGINAVEIGGDPPNGLTYSNEAHRAMQRLSNVTPYLVRFERAFASWIPGNQYVKFNGDSIVRSDIQTRYQVYKLAREIGSMNIDEIRALEDQPPLPNGLGQDFTPAVGMIRPTKETIPAPGQDQPAPPAVPKKAAAGSPQSRVIDLLADMHA